MSLHVREGDHPPAAAGGKWSSGLCSCFSDCTSCLTVCCLKPVALGQLSQKVLGYPCLFVTILLFSLCMLEDIFGVFEQAPVSTISQYVPVDNQMAIIFVYSACHSHPAIRTRLRRHLVFCVLRRGGHRAQHHSPPRQDRAGDCQGLRRLHQRRWVLSHTGVRPAHTRLFPDPHCAVDAPPLPAAPWLARGLLPAPLLCRSLGLRPLLSTQSLSCPVCRARAQARTSAAPSAALHAPFVR